MHILFVCSRNKWRSPTAEALYKHSAVHVVKSAGTEPSARVRVTAKHILWADLIFAMERRHQQRLQQRFPVEIAGKKLIVLDIADEYQYMDAELVTSIKAAVAPYLDA